MARRRINVRFLIVTASVAGLSAGMGVLLYKNHKPRNPQPYIQTGDLNVKNGEYAKAITNYGIAEGMLPTDVSLHTKLGNALYQGRGLAMDNLNNAANEFTKAVELNPDSKEGWEGLFEVNETRLSQWESHPGDVRERDQLPISLGLAREASEHLLKLEPQSIDAQSAEPILIIRAWLANLAIPQSYAESILPPDKQMTADQQAEQAVVQLSKLMADHPENEKLPYWIARAKIYQAQLNIKNDQPALAVPLFNEASNQFDQSIDKRPDVMGLELNKAAILSTLQQADPDATHWQDYRQRAHDALDKAQQLADPKNASQYQMAKQQWAMNLSTYDAAKSEAVWRDLITRYPDQLEFRIHLAQLLSAQPARRADAIDLLNEINKFPGPVVTNFGLRQLWEMQVTEAKLEKADVETQMLTTTPPGDARVQLTKDIQSALDYVKGRFGDNWNYLRVLGQFQLNSGQVRDSIVTLTAAVDKMSVDTGAVSSQLLHDQALAYERGGQTTKAIEILETVIKDPAKANDPEMHLTLGRLCIQNKDFVKARTYVDWLWARYQDDPKIITLRIQAMGPDADPEAIKPLFDKLPENSADAIRYKDGFAAQLGNKDEQIRLTTLLHKSDPDDIRVTSSLVQLLASVDKTDQAKQVLADAIKAHPDNPTLKLLNEGLNNASREDMQSTALASIAAITDPFQREQRYVSYYRLQQDQQQVLAHLKKEVELQPDNAAALQELFFWYVDARRFPDAEAMIPRLVQTNADNANGLILETKLSLAKQDVPSALIFSRQMTHDFPNFAPSFELYGEALRASGQLEAACQQFVTALSLQATNIDASQNLIQCSVQQGKLDDARGYINDARKRFPNDPTYRDMHFTFEILYGNAASVLPELQALIQKNPTDPRSYGLLADACLASMRAAAREGQPEQASQYLAQARDVFQQTVTRWPDDLRFNNELAQMYVQTGDLNTAIDLMKKFSDRPRWKTNAAPLIPLGRLYMQARKLPEAYDVLHRAQELDPHSIEACLTLCECLERQNKFNDALAVMQPLTADFNVRARYTDLLIAMGGARAAQAEVSLQDAIRADPTNMGLTNLLLHVYDAEGKWDRGIRAASDEIAKDPRNVYAYFLRGKMEASSPTPDLDSAYKDLTLYRDSVPTNLDGRVMLSAVLDARHDHDAAIHELEIALGFDQENRQIRSLLLRDYLNSSPPRNIDAEHLLSQTLSMPSFQHDPEFETKSAVFSARRGDIDKAILLMQDAMKNTTDKPALLPDYLDVLLTSGAKDPKYLQMLLDESSGYITDPSKTSWIVFNQRACAKAALGDKDGAKAEFTTAMDRAGTEPGRNASESVAFNASQRLGVEQALDMVLPRAQNSVTWKVVAIDLLMNKGDFAKGMAMVDSTLAADDSLTPADRFHLYESAASLYLNNSPPLIDKAIPIYQKILAVQPDDLMALNDMACILVDMSTPPKPTEALTYSQRAYDQLVKAGRVNPRIYDTQGWVLLRNGRLDDAIDVMHHEIDAADFPEAHYHLAEAYLQKQMPEEAQHELSSASDLLQAKKSDTHTFVDSGLKDKIDAALKQVDDMIRAKSSDKTAF
jgi:tetratricopeptide (TPR) repeat protein